MDELAEVNERVATEYRHVCSKDTEQRMLDDLRILQRQLAEARERAEKAAAEESSCHGKLKHLMGVLVDAGASVSQPHDVVHHANEIRKLGQRAEQAEADNAALVGVLRQFVVWCERSDIPAPGTEPYVIHGNDVQLAEISYDAAKALRADHPGRSLTAKLAEAQAKGERLKGDNQRLLLEVADKIKAGLTVVGINAALKDERDRLRTEAGRLRGALEACLTDLQGIIARNQGGFVGDRNAVKGQVQALQAALTPSAQGGEHEVS